MSEAGVEIGGPEREARDRAVRLLDFLQAVRALQEPPVRDVATYSDKRWWQYDLPDHPAVALGGDATGDGSWLRVTKAELEPPPGVPTGLQPFVLETRNSTDPIRPPALDDSVVGTLGQEEAESIRTSFDQWITTTWSTWQQRVRPAVAARRLYEDLFDLRNRLKREEALFELAWGHGVLTWARGADRICAPVTTTPVQVEFEMSTGAISVGPAGETALELDMLSGLGLTGFESLVDRRERFRTEPVDMWDPIESREVFEEFLSPLGLDTRISDPPVPTPTSSPDIAATSILFVRRRKTMFQQFFEKLRLKLEVDALRLPPPIAAVVADEPSTMVLTGDGEIASAWAAVGEQLLMPLPSNPEQERIARQLAVNRGVTVQGPPGTGKTHTIANLICHLIAHGKRVLVTSHKEQPLEVLRDKLPETLRPLCVSVLGSSKGSTAQLDRSVQEIYSRAVGLDRALARERVGERELELDGARRRLAEIRDRTRALVERESETYVTGSREFSPAELARWLAEHEPELGFIGDRIAPGADCPLKPDEFAQLYRLVAELEPDDLIECRRSLPDASAFISGVELVDAVERLRSVRDRLADIDLGTWQGVDDLGRGGLAALAESVRHAALELATVENEWLSRLRDEMIRNPVSATVWRDNAKLLREGINETLTWRAELTGHVVQLPSDAFPTKEQVAELEQLRDRFAEGKGVSRLRHRDLYQLCQSCTVDQEAPSTAADVSLLLATARAARRRWELVQRWNQEVGRVGGPPLDLAAAYPEDVLDRALGEIESALTWEFETWPRLWERLNDAGLAPPTRVSLLSLEAIATQVRGATDRFEERDLADWLGGLTSYVKSGAAHPDASDLWARLESSLATWG